LEGVLATAEPVGRWLDASTTRRRRAVLDLFYVALGIAGIVALWGVAKMCERA
jgi:hypothetical protein